MSDQKRVAILIPFYNHFPVFRGAVIRLFETTAVKSEDIFVIDDSVDPAESEACQTLCAELKLMYYKNPENVGFLKSVSLGFEETDHPFVLLYNSDVWAIDWGWLDEMLAEMDNPQVGIVGAKLVFPPEMGQELAHKIQHAGVATNSEGMPYHIFAGEALDHPSTNKRLEVNAVTGACMLIRRSVWDELGGFDPQLGRGVYEDIDLCWRARKANYLVVYCASAVLYHFQHGSVEVDGTHKLHNFADNNLVLLIKKWGQTFASDEGLFGVTIPKNQGQIPKELSPLWIFRDRPITSYILKSWIQADPQTQQALVGEVQDILRAYAAPNLTPVMTQEVVQAEAEAVMIEKLTDKRFTPEQITQIMSIYTRNEDYPKKDKKRRRR